MSESNVGNNDIDPLLQQKTKKKNLHAGSWLIASCSDGSVLVYQINDLNTNDEDSSQMFELFQKWSMGQGYQQLEL